VKITYYVGTSLDAYIARADGDVSWLDDLGIPLEETGFAEFYATVDGIIMGRKTWEQIAGFGDWPYDDRPTWVVSGSEVDPIAGAVLKDERDLEQAVAAARTAGVQHLWLVGGGQLAAGVINAGLLTDIIVTQLPVILGHGIALFSGVHELTSIKMSSCMTNTAGFAVLSYKVAADG
jgi:dihydrofolate reductase